MKVLVYGAESFMGINIIERFCKEDFRVVGIYKDKKPDFAAKSAHSKYVCPDIDNIGDIFSAERPEIVIYALTNKIQTLEESKKKISEMTALADYSAIYHTSKFIYLSSINIYDADKCDELDKPMPRGIDEKTHTLCENALYSFRTDPSCFSVILRLPEVTGFYGTLNHESVVFKMIEEASKKRVITTGLNKMYALLSAGDVADAVFRSVSDSVDGIYNITPKCLTPGTEIANSIYAALGMENKEAEKSIDKKKLPHLPSNHKAAMEMGFICLTKTETLINSCVEWYEEAAKVKSKTEEKKAHRVRLVFQLIESIAIFLICAFITYKQGESGDVFTVNLLTLYIILISTFFGINHSIFSAILVSGFDVFYSVSHGYSLTSTIYNLNVLTAIVQNIVIAISIGYVIDRKNYSINEKDILITKQQGEISYLKQINQDLGNIKNEQEQRVLKYEYGFGMIYSAIKCLNTLSPKEIFFNSLVAVKNLINENNISLYIIQPQSGYLRQFVYIGEKPKKFPKSYRLSDSEIIRDVIENNRFYTNNYLNAEMPSVIMPISVDGTVIALIMIEDMDFEKLTLYYLNILRVAGSLLNDTFSRASIYESFSSKFVYEENTNILKAEEFKKALELAKEASEKSEFEYCVLSLSSKAFRSDAEMARCVERCTRNTDEIGRAADGTLGLILYSTSKDYSSFIIDRLNQKKIKAVLKEL